MIYFKVPGNHEQMSERKKGEEITKRAPNSGNFDLHERPSENASKREHYGVKCIKNGCGSR